MTDSVQIVPEQSNHRKSVRRTLDHRFRHHRLVLIAALFVIAMSFLLEVVPNGRVAFRGFEQWPLPHSCYSRTLFDFGCPGCGLTRGFIHLANGRIAESLAVNRIAWFVALATLLQIPYRIAALRSETGKPLGTLWPKAFFCTLALVMLANWFYELLTAA